MIVFFRSDNRARNSIFYRQLENYHQQTMSKIINSVYVYWPLDWLWLTYGSAKYKPRRRNDVNHLLSAIFYTGNFYPSYKLYYLSETLTKNVETIQDFSRYWPFVKGIQLSTVDNQVDSDLRRHRAQCAVTVMIHSHHPAIGNGKQRIICWNRRY